MEDILRFVKSLAEAEVNGVGGESFGFSHGDFKKSPFSMQVLGKKLGWSEIPTKITFSAAFLLYLYSKDNPGLIQLMFLKCLEEEKEVITTSTITKLWPIEMINSMSRELEALWDLQKVTAASRGVFGSDNLVDSKGFWNTVYSGYSVEDAIEYTKRG